MNAYLTKPLNLVELLHTREVYTAMASDTNNATPQAYSAGPAANDAPYDRAELLERLSGDEELFGTIVEVFVGDLGNMQEGLHQAVSAHDAKRIEQAAHKLKGALLNLSAGPAARLAKSLEDMGRAGVLDAPEVQVVALEKALKALQSALTRGAPRA